MAILAGGAKYPIFIDCNHCQFFFTHTMEQNSVDPSLLCNFVPFPPILLYDIQFCYPCRIWNPELVLGDGGCMMHPDQNFVQQLV